MITRTLYVVCALVCLVNGGAIMLGGHGFMPNDGWLWFLVGGGLIREQDREARSRQPEQHLPASTTPDVFL